MENLISDLNIITEENREDIELVALNGTVKDIDTYYHLLKYDSVHGAFPEIKKISDEALDFGRGPVKVLCERDPAKLPTCTSHGS